MRNPIHDSGPQQAQQEWAEPVLDEPVRSLKSGRVNVVEQDARVRSCKAGTLRPGQVFEHRLVGGLVFPDALEDVLGRSTSVTSGPGGDDLPFGIAVVSGRHQHAIWRRYRR